jgi:hypothetical protein
MMAAIKSRRHYNGGSRRVNIISYLRAPLCAFSCPFLHQFFTDPQGLGLVLIA